MELRVIRATLIGDTWREAGDVIELPEDLGRRLLNEKAVSLQVQGITVAKPAAARVETPEKKASK